MRKRKEGAMEKILCVDDDPIVLQLYYEELTDEGYKVILATDGKEALSKYSKEKPDLVILDIRMAGMNGLDVLTAILGKDRQASIILNTAYPQHRENFMSWGAEAYVIKSSDVTELKQKVQEVLEKRKKAERRSPNLQIYPVWDPA
jgi:DNA-binding response OmpR family regulator